MMTDVSKKDKQMKETMRDQGETFSKRPPFRLKQISRKREAFLEHLDRTDKLVARKKGSSESTMKNTLETTEQAWNNNLKFHEILEESEEPMCNMRLMPKWYQKVE